MGWGTVPWAERGRGPKGAGGRKLGVWLTRPHNQVPNDPPPPVGFTYCVRIIEEVVGAPLSSPGSGVVRIGTSKGYFCFAGCGATCVGDPGYEPGTSILSVLRPKTALSECNRRSRSRISAIYKYTRFHNAYRGESPNCPLKTPPRCGYVHSFPPILNPSHRRNKGNRIELCIHGRTATKLLE